MIPPVRRVRNGLSSSRLLVAFLVGVGCPAAMAAWSQITWVAALVMVLGTLPILVIESRIWQRLNRRKWERRLPTLLMRFSVSSLTDLAALLAGSRRPALRDEWRAHPAGKSGHDPVTWAVAYLLLA